MSKEISLQAKAMAKARARQESATKPGSTKKVMMAESEGKLWLNFVEVIQDDATLLHLRAKPGSRSKVPEVTTSKFLETFLWPYTREEFVSNVLHNRALAITGFGDRRTGALLKDYFEGGHVKDLISNTASQDGVSIWLPNADKAIESFKSQDMNFTCALFENVGASLYMRAPKQTCEDLTLSMFRDLKMPFGQYPDGSSRGEVEVFLASRPSRRTPTHTDFQENFTFQLIGTKRWRLHLGDVTNPLRAKSPHFANTPQSVIENQLLASQACGGSSHIQSPPDSSTGWAEVILHPGDILYHPPGIWHNVETVSMSDSPSEHQICLNVNISLFSPTWADVVGRAVRQLLWQHPLLRRPCQLDDLCLIREMLDALGFASLLHVQQLVPPGVSHALTNLVQTSNDHKTNEEYEVDEDEDNSPTVIYDWQDDIEPVALSGKVLIRNSLALLLFDLDFDGNTERVIAETCKKPRAKRADLPVTFDVVIHINIGSSDLESCVRFEIHNVNIALLGEFARVRDLHASAIYETPVALVESDKFVTLMYTCGVLTFQ